MSLVAFHRSLILAAIAFCFLYAGWEFRAWTADANTGAAVLGVIFALLGIGLVVYLARLPSILKLEE